MSKTKVCPRCKEEKSLEEFLLVKGKPQGRCRPCRTLTNSEKKEQRANKYLENREAILQRQKEYLARNREKRRAYCEKYYEENKEVVLAKRRLEYSTRAPEKLRNQNARRYGKDINWWVETFNKQGHRCAICGSETSKSSGDFHIDHCHESGKVRGLLCSLCNTGLGKFEDNIQYLLNAVEYLIEHQSETAKEKDKYD